MQRKREEDRLEALPILDLGKFCNRLVLVVSLPSSYALLSTSFVKIFLNLNE